MAEMKDVSADLQRPGTSTERKVTAGAVTVASGSAAVLSGTILWALGCIKGHQFYMPDDMLVLGWAAALAPTLYAIKLKLDDYFGLHEQ